MSVVSRDFNLPFFGSRSSLIVFIDLPSRVEQHKGILLIYPLYKGAGRALSLTVYSH